MLYFECLHIIVFGFFQDKFIGIEQGLSHRVPAGWQKGAAQGGVNLVFLLNVSSADSDASKLVQFST